MGVNKRLATRERPLSDNGILLEIFNGDSILRTLTDLEKFAMLTDVKRSLDQSGRYLINKGKQRLRSRMKSGTRGVTGNLLKSFKKKVKKGNRGVLAGFRYGKGGGSHAHLVDQGTKQRKTKKGYNRGRLLGNRFWTDTRESDTQKAMDIVMDAVIKAWERLDVNRWRRGGIT